MRHASIPAPAGWQSPFAKMAPPKGAFARVVYRSRAVKSLSAPELRDLTRASQRRNGREGITGLMLYDSGRFFQWLEGPAANVEQLMAAIRVDARHTDVEVLNKEPAEMRTFGSWSMKLAAPGIASAEWHRDVIEPPREIVEDLLKRPEAAPALLVKLVSVTARVVQPTLVESVAQLPLAKRAEAILKNVFVASVIPQLSRATKAFPARNLPLASQRAQELAGLLVSPDPAAALDLIDAMQADGAAIGMMAATLLEPAARGLGDLWAEDLCSEFDVTVGLCRLQAAVRLLTSGAPARRPNGLRQPVVLIAPEPGELHRLGAALDRSVLEHAGWSPHCEYPADDDALDELVNTTWFDVLDLSLSAAFRREQSMQRLTDTIVNARRASRNPGLVVVVGGRMFMEEKAAGRAVGADGSNATSLNLNRSILRTLTAAKTDTETETTQGTLQVTAA